VERAHPPAAVDFDLGVGLTLHSRTQIPPDAPSSAVDTPPEASAQFDQFSDSALTEDRALAVLKMPDLSAESIVALSKNASLIKSRKVRLALAAHPRTPRRIALRLVRELYTFDLMQFALLPTVAADLKRAAGNLLIARIESITLGERIALARRCSESVAAALLLDKESRVWQTALENPRLTESAIVKALQRTNAAAALVEAVCRHPKWSVRPEIRMALLRNEKTSLARALEFARRLPPAQLRDILHNSRLPDRIKTLLRKELADC
jgi:hypothetical protein